MDLKNKQWLCDPPVSGGPRIWFPSGWVSGHWSAGWVSCSAQSLSWPAFRPVHRFGSQWPRSHMANWQGNFTPPAACESASSLTGTHNFIIQNPCLSLHSSWSSTALTHLAEPRASPLWTFLKISPSSCGVCLCPCEPVARIYPVFYVPCLKFTLLLFLGTTLLTKLMVWLYYVQFTHLTARQ